MVIAGTHSGVGKTTVATGLMAALRHHGDVVGSAKVGPDFIDPGYHQLATGRPGRNLDPFLSGPQAIAPLAGRAAAGTDILVVEGVMGLFDGVGATMESSTAEVAALLGAPVLLVVDSSSVSGSIGALVHGYDDYLRKLRGSGVDALVLNRVGSATHESILREALAPLGLPVLGALCRDQGLAWRDRHLGLVPVIEDTSSARASLQRLAERIEASLDLERLRALARTAPAVRVGTLPPARRNAAAPVPVAVASGPAFSFCYTDNLERLTEAGAEVLWFDPLHDPALPVRASALYAGGGFPEEFAHALAQNVTLRRDVKRRAQQGLAIWAECGGLLWLCESLDGTPLCGVIPARGHMGDRPTVGYRRATVRGDNPVASRHTRLRGHEHHYSWIEPAGKALELQARDATHVAGWASRSLLASYLHLHLGADPTPAERFVASAARNPGGRR